MTAHEVRARVTLAFLHRIWRASHSWKAREQPGRGGHPWRPFAVRLLDIRDGEGFAQAHLPAAVSVPAEELDARVYELPPKVRPFYVLADEPGQAEAFTARLRERGWLACRAVADPVAAWPGPWEHGPARHVLWEPSRLVRHFLALVPPGPVLDAGCGAGRDAVYMASRGRTVVAVDRLPDALAMARALAARCTVALDLRLADLERQRPPDAPVRGENEPRTGTPCAPEERGYAAIVGIRYLPRALAGWIPSGLRPGGLFILEAHLAPAAGDSPRRNRLRPREALALFVRDGLEILYYREGSARSAGPVARLVLRRPPEPRPQPGEPHGTH
ncbi:MAG: methyltransferase domain-containing protein [Candidatus Eisenbacteria bacterium]